MHEGSCHCGAVRLTLPATPEVATALEVAAADNLKRVRRAPDTEPDWALEPDLTAMSDFLETKTVWHPIGL